MLSSVYLSTTLLAALYESQTVVRHLTLPERAMISCIVKKDWRSVAPKSGKVTFIYCYRQDEPFKSLMKLNPTAKFQFEKAIINVLSPSKAQQRLLNEFARFVADSDRQDWIRWSNSGSEDLPLETPGLVARVASNLDWKIVYSHYGRKLVIETVIVGFH